MVIDFSSIYDVPNDLERFLNGVFRNSPLNSRGMDYPRVNIAENDDGYIVDVCLPGVDTAEV